MSWRAGATTYVLVVAGVATFGFLHDSTAAILIAAALALPSGAPGLVGYYAAYGLLAQVPGANPSQSSGGTTCRADGVCRSWSTGDAAAWFTTTTDVVGVAALTLAAVVNVLLWRLIRRHPARRPTVGSR